MPSGWINWNIIILLSIISFVVVTNYDNIINNLQNLVLPLEDGDPDDAQRDQGVEVVAQRDQGVGVVAQSDEGHWASEMGDDLTGGMKLKRSLGGMKLKRK